MTGGEGGRGMTARDFFKPVCYKIQAFEESMTYGRPSDFSLEKSFTGMPVGNEDLGSLEKVTRVKF